MKNQVLEGKISIVTGGAGGIGKAIAKRYLAEGAVVIIADVKEELLKETEAEFKAAGYEKIDSFVVNLRNPEEIDAMVNYAKEKYGRLDVLVNNAGIQIRGWMTEYKNEDWQAMMDVNVTAPYYASRAASRIMKEQGGGVILFTSSANSFRFTTCRIPYCTTKAAVNALAGSIANEMGRFNIRANAIAPGNVRTGMWDTAVAKGTINVKQMEETSGLKRVMEPEEIASAFCYLASDEASGITGQVIYVDGGWFHSGYQEEKDYVLSDALKK